MFKQAKQNEIPVFLVDASIPSPLKTLDQYNLLMIMEALASTYLVNILVRLKTNNEESIRRTVLKKVGKILAAAGLTWGLSPVVTKGGLLVAYETGVGNGTAVAAKKNAQKTHPELGDILVHFRNLLMAYKLIKLLKEEHARNITLAVGYEHCAIEDILVAYKNGDVDLQKIEKDTKDLSINNITFSKANDSGGEMKKGKIV